MGVFNRFGDYEALSVSVPVCATAPLTYTFKRTYPFRVISLEQSCAAADATDNVTVSFVVGTDVRMTGAPNVTAKTIISNIAADAGKVLEVAADALCHITLAFAGTAANVKGLFVVVTIQPTR
jgi:hypothetical protein